MRDKHSHTRIAVCSKLATCIKTEPTDPKHGSADHNHRWVIAPYNGETFYEWLETQEPDLTSLSFAVCALGDTGYPSFAQAGKDFDRFLEEAGGTRILPRVELDACFDESIEPFIEQIKSWLLKYGESFRK